MRRTLVLAVPLAAVFLVVLGIGLVVLASSGFRLGCWSSFTIRGQGRGNECAILDLVRAAFRVFETVAPLADEGGDQAQ